MQIESLGLFYNTNQYAVNAFTEILNMIVSSENIMDFNKKLMNSDFSGRISAHFVWSFEDYTFSVWQRIDYGSEICFGHKLIELQFVKLVCKDRRRANITYH